MISPPVPDGRLAGYRLVRKLGVGSRSDVYLGVGAAGSVALKVFVADTPRESIGAELDALGRLDSPHLVRLLDVSSLSGELPILVLERLEQGSVASLLAEREDLECGEAVTLLAPIAGLVAELHDAGVAHTRIGATSIHLGSQGQPVLIGLGYCALFTPASSMAAIDREPSAAVDRDALAAYALAVLGRVRADPREARIRQLEEWIQNAPRAFEFPRQLEERLFAFSEALPVASPAGAPSRSVVPLRAVPSRAVPSRAVPSKRETQPPAELRQAPEVPARALPGWLPALLLENPVGALKTRALAAARGIRPRFWIAAGAVAVGLTLAVALVPSTGATTPDRAAGAVTTAPPSPRSVPTVAPLPSDPVEAAKILVVARERCISELSILCLDTVDEASSAAFSGDSAIIQQIQYGGEIPKPRMPASSGLALVERMGDSALIGPAPGAEGVTTNHPASILMIRTTAGWRIRDVLTGAQATGRATG